MLFYIYDYCCVSLNPVSVGKVMMLQTHTKITIIKYTSSSKFDIVNNWPLFDYFTVNVPKWSINQNQFDIVEDLLSFSIKHFELVNNLHTLKSFWGNISFIRRTYCIAEFPAQRHIYMLTYLLSLRSPHPLSYVKVAASKANLL